MAPAALGRAADAPQQVGAYVVEGELGRGAGGRVVQARGPDGSRVAIKLALGEAQARLRREAELASRLDHPGVVRLLDAGELTRWGPFVVYELIDGARTLDAAWAGLGFAARLELVVQVADAVAHAHARGVLHRDLKPDNVLVDAASRVRVIDFGVGAAGDLDRLTRTGAMVGTPRYMSPEQLFGERDRQGPASDVWALGVLLHEALTAEHPFPADTLTELGAAVLRADELQTPVPDDLPPALGQVCGRAVQPDPAARYPVAAAFADAVRAAQVGGPQRARGAGVAGALVVVAVALAGALTAALASGTDGGPRPASPPPESPAPADPRGELAAARSTADEQRLSALLAWAATYPDRPEQGEVRAELRRWARAGPLRRVALGGGSLTVVFDDDRTLWVCAADAPRVTRLDATGKSDTAWALAAPAHWLAVAAGAVVAMGPELAPVLLLPDGDSQTLGWEPGWSLALSPDGRRLALGRSDAIDRVGFADGQALGALATSEGNVRHLGFVGDLLVGAIEPRPENFRAGGSMDVLEIRDWTSGELRDRLLLAGAPTALAVSSTGLCAVGTRDGRLMLADPAGSRSPVFLQAPDLPEPAGLGQGNPFAQAHRRDLAGVAFAGPRTLVSVAPLPVGGALRVWDVDGGGEHWRARLASRPSSVAASPDGSRLAVGTADGVVELWLLELP